MKLRKLFAVIMGVLAIEGVVLTGIFVLSPGDKVYGEMDQSTGSGSKERECQNDRSGDSTKEKRERAGQKGEQEAWKIYEKNKQLLILVNARKALPEGYDASLRTICNGRLQASDRMYDELADMLEDASAKGHRYWIASAWRSRQKQQKLVDQDVRAGMEKGMSYELALKETYKETMPAGHSEHETGLALDILCSGNMAMDRSQETEPGNLWLRENSWRYGFILRYPENKKSLTGINYEPWHFRYVGKKAAAYMHSHNLTLEEFWEELMD